MLILIFEYIHLEKNSAIQHTSQHANVFLLYALNPTAPPQKWLVEDLYKMVGAHPKTNMEHEKDRLEKQKDRWMNMLKAANRTASLCHQRSKVFVL